MNLSIRFYLLVVATIVTKATAIDWQTSGDVRWSLKCDFNGNDFTSQRSKGEECGGICQSNSQCTHFTWTDFNGGTCWLKRGSISPNNAVDKFDSSAVCGYVSNKISAAINWQPSGDVRWSLNCDFNGNDLTSQRSKGEECGGICESNRQCTHFTWTNFNGGTCWLKRGSVSPNNAVIKTTDSAVCGYVNSRISGSDPGGPIPVSGVKGTFWAETSDAGGCQMPSGDYEVTDAIALGQADQLGSLKWKQGLCGQVLRIDCGNGAIDTVVASTCNLNSNTCGIDMIGKTWRRATNNQSPGTTQCKVELTARNPIRGGSPLCYYRPNSETSNAYFAIIGLVNTSGKITSSATLAGVQGKRNNDGWFEFNGNGQPLFQRDADAIFNYEDGSSTRMKLGDCRSGGQVKIFQ